MQIGSQLTAIMLEAIRPLMKFLVFSFKNFCPVFWVLKKIKLIRTVFRMNVNIYILGIIFNEKEKNESQFNRMNADAGTEENR